MKKVLFISIVVMISFLFSACNQQPTPQKVTTAVTAEKVTYSDGGFYVEQQIIVAGNTVWGISEKSYGTGLRWRDIVALNPFLNTPDRLYYNPDRKMWIVRIYPGEVLNIGGQKVYPSCTYESTTTVTTTEPAQSSSPNLEWWGWLIIAGIVLIALLIFSTSFRSGVVTAFSNSNSSSSVRVDIHNGIDIDTRRALIERDQDFRDDVLYMLDRDAKRKGRLHGCIIEATPERFFVAADYYKRGGGRNKRRKDEPKKDAAN